MFRIGSGWDSHEFKKNVALRIGGVKLAHTHGLAGHSDGDVLLHALTDALLGAVAAGDIGSHFPPSDPRWKGADSTIFVGEALKQVTQAGYAVGNVDCTLILVQPKIGPHAARMRKHVAELLHVAASSVSIKAKTPEGVPTENTAIAQVIVLLIKKGSDQPEKHEAAEAVPQQVVDQVVKDVLKSMPSPPRKQRTAHPVKGKLSRN